MQRGFSGAGRGKLLSDAEPLHLLEEGVPVYAQELGGLSLIALDLLQDPENIVAFKMVAGLLQRDSPYLGLFEELGFEESTRQRPAR